MWTVATYRYNAYITTIENKPDSIRIGMRRSGKTYVTAAKPHELALAYLVVQDEYLDVNETVRDLRTALYGWMSRHHRLESLDGRSQHYAAKPSISVCNPAYMFLYQILHYIPSTYLSMYLVRVKVYLVSCSKCAWHVKKCG